MLCWASTDVENVTGRLEVDVYSSRVLREQSQVGTTSCGKDRMRKLKNLFRVLQDCLNFVSTKVIGDANSE